MKNAVLIAIALMLVPSAAVADTPGDDWMSIGSIESLLAREGYRLTEIEAKDDHWEAEATRHGRTWDFKLNPKTGRVISVEPDTD